MFSWNGTGRDQIANWLACLVVSATIQFHPSCDKLEPYFRTVWSENQVDIATLMNEVLKKAEEENMEKDFQYTPVKTGKQTNFTGQIPKPAEKVVGEVSKDRKPKASKANMPEAMWEQYIKCHENTELLPAAIHAMRDWCSSNKICYRCYKTECRTNYLNSELSKEERKANADKCFKFAESEGYVMKVRRRPKKDTKVNQAKDSAPRDNDVPLRIPICIDRPIIPDNQEAWDKKNMVSAINQHKEPVDISQSEEIQQLKTNIKQVKDDINDKQEETKNWENKNLELSRKVIDLEHR